MKIKSVFSHAFAQYGRVITGYDAAALTAALEKNSEKPADGTKYEPSLAALESLPAAAALSDGVYGGQPVQIGYCNGRNTKLNCLEYHRGSELNIPCDDIVLLLASVQKIHHNHLDTSAVEAFRVPRGTIVQIYETTLHYAPCCAPKMDGFRVVIVLPRGTNTAKPVGTGRNEEDKLLWARNKWLLAHPDSAEAKKGACAGLTGKNIDIAKECAAR